MKKYIVLCLIVLNVMIMTNAEQHRMRTLGDVAKRKMDCITQKDPYEGAEVEWDILCPRRDVPDGASHTGHDVPDGTSYRTSHLDVPDGI